MLSYIATSKFELKGIIQITSNLQFVSLINIMSEVLIIEFLFSIDWLDKISNISHITLNPIKHEDNIKKINGNITFILK